MLRSCPPGEFSGRQNCQAAVGISRYQLIGRHSQQINRLQFTGRNSSRNGRVQCSALGRKKPRIFSKPPKRPNKHNIEPDLSDPDWPSKVTDWDEFWNYQRWDTARNDLDIYIDAAGNGTLNSNRGMKMIQAIRDIETRGDVINWMPPENRLDNSCSWEHPPMRPSRPDPTPHISEFDARAIAEKRKQRERLDQEWRRRQSCIGRAKYVDGSRDVRLEYRAHELHERQWSEAEIAQLITGNADAATVPTDHKGILVENPLAPQDWAGVHGATWVEETEDFLRRIGRLANDFDRDVEQRDPLDDYEQGVQWGLALAPGSLHARNNAARRVFVRSAADIRGEPIPMDQYDGEGGDDDAEMLLHRGDGDDDVHHSASWLDADDAEEEEGELGFGL